MTLVAAWHHGEIPDLVKELLGQEREKLDALGWLSKWPHSCGNDSRWEEPGYLPYTSTISPYISPASPSICLQVGGAGLPPRLGPVLRPALADHAAARDAQGRARVPNPNQST